LWFNRNDYKRPLWVVFAAIMTILVFSIPHSMFGSELDPDSGKIIQGTILPFIATLLP
jgi:hypothetical protein